MNYCPACGAQFEYFLRWQVVRTFSLRRVVRMLMAIVRCRPANPPRDAGDFAVICRACKEVVGYES